MIETAASTVIHSPGSHQQIKIIEAIKHGFSQIATGPFSWVDLCSSPKNRRGQSFYNWRWTFCPFFSQWRKLSPKPSKMFPVWARYGSRISQATLRFDEKLKTFRAFFQLQLSSPNDQILLAILWGWPVKPLKQFPICWMTITETRLSASGATTGQWIDPQGRKRSLKRTGKISQAAWSYGDRRGRIPPKARIADNLPPSGTK